MSGQTDIPGSSRKFEQIQEKVTQTSMERSSRPPRVHFRVTQSMGSQCVLPCEDKPQGQGHQDALSQEDSEGRVQAWLRYSSKGRMIWLRKGVVRRRAAGGLPQT